MGHPLDVDTGAGLVRDAVEHIPFLGAMAGATRRIVVDERKISLWQLIVSLGGLAIVLGGVIVGLAIEMTRQQRDLVAVDKAVIANEAMITYIRKRQEADEERTNKLEAAAAVTDSRFNQMTREHSDIYQAIRDSRGEARVAAKRAAER